MFCLHSILIASPMATKLQDHIYIPSLGVDSYVLKLGIVNYTSGSATYKHNRNNVGHFTFQYPTLDVTHIVWMHSCKSCLHTLQVAVEVSQCCASEHNHNGFGCLDLVLDQPCWGESVQHHIPSTVIQSTSDVSHICTWPRQGHCQELSNTNCILYGVM